MNENLRVGEQFFRIIREFEKAPADCRQTDEGAALDAYLCPSGQWTLGLGCCYWHDDGRMAQQGDTLDPSQVYPMLAYNARYCEDYVRENVTVELTQNQFDVLCSFRFNTRESTLRNSSRLLPAINAKEWQKAAIAFTEFVYGTSTFDGKPYQKALRGILRRQLWHGLIFLDLDPAEAVKQDDVALPCDRKLMGNGVYRDMIRTEGLTTLNQVKMRATPLAQAELVLTQPAPPLVATTKLDGKAEQPGADPQSQPPVVSAHVKEPAKIEHDTADVSKIPPKVSPAPTPPSPAKKPEAINPAPPQSPRAPVPPPKLPDPPVPIGQQTSAVDAARKSEEWSHSAKSMIFSRRFWGLFLVVIGRVWMLKTGSNAVLGAVSDPLVMEMFSGFMVMMLGELVQRWGERKATRPLR